jgi:uncharacterized metal-binding protein
MSGNIATVGISDFLQKSRGDEEKLIMANPVITIDGCPKSCAQISVEARGVTPARTYQETVRLPGYWA